METADIQSLVNNVYDNCKGSSGRCKNAMFQDAADPMIVAVRCASFILRGPQRPFADGAG
jgi:hypothetical protein